jgi:L-iditol 2-dehydrogenase
MNIPEFMYAAVLHAPGRLETEKVPVPKISDDDVLVKVESCGICGSDVPRVLTTGTYHFPTIPGHELSGIVCRTGSNVDASLLDKRVAVIPLIPCRTCDMCEVGHFAQCRHYDFIGSRCDGGFAQYVKVPARNLVLCPDSVTDDMACMLEPISVALHVVKNCHIHFGDTVAVFGLGAIGIFIAQWAKAFGARKVFAIDIDKKKIEIARSMGMDGVLLSETDPKEYIKALCPGGIDRAIDASGVGESFANGIRCLRPSGILGLVGRYGKAVGITPELSEQLLRKQLTVQGTWSFEFTSFPAHAWKMGLEALETGKIITEPIVSHRLHLNEVLHGIRDIMANKEEPYFKILVQPQT